MSKQRVFLAGILVLALAGGFTLNGFTVNGLAPAAQEQQQGQAPPAAQEPKPRRAVVTFDGDLEALPTLAPADFEIEAGKQKFNPARLYRPEEMPTVLAIVLQENQLAEFGTQLPALRDFILAQPPNTYVGVFYLSMQAVETAVMFDSNLPKVAEALRAPKGMRDLAPPSPYISVAKLINGMAQLPDARKEILWFAEGSDATAGDATSGQNANLGQAVRHAQNAGIPVFVIYSAAIPPSSRLVSDTSAASGTIPGSGQSAGQQTPGSSSGGRDVFSGGGSPSGGGSRMDDSSPYSPPVQYSISYLNYLADRTGGKVLTTKAAPDIKPFLDQFRRLMTLQYVVEYPADETIKKLKLRQKIEDTKLLHPKR